MLPAVMCVQEFYVLDPTQGIQHLFLMPEFAAARGTARTPDVVGSFWASPYFKDLVERTNNALASPQNSPYQVGADGVQLTLSTINTTTAFFLR